MPCVYVAGSSRELPRVREAVWALGMAGVTALDAWLSDVEQHGSAGAGLTDEQRAACAARDLRDIDAADAVLVLWPETPSVGAYVELGYAMGRLVHERGIGPHILIVGGDSIWHAWVRNAHTASGVMFSGETFADVESAIEWMRHEMHVCGEWPAPTWCVCGHHAGRHEPVDVEDWGKCLDPACGCDGYRKEEV